MVLGPLERVDDMRTEICIGGSGGQGVLLFGAVMTHAASFEGKGAVCLPSYGAEARGGNVKCFVILSESTVKSPFPEHFHYLVFFNDAAFVRFKEYIKPGVKIFYNSSESDGSLVPQGVEAMGVPLNRLVEDLDKRSINMAMLGAFAEYNNLLESESMASGLKGVAKNKNELFITTNLEAIEEGRRWALECLDTAPSNP
jgi:2-oxoglutarate ferredoxin oxidoreductase subunit gamma